MRRGGVESKDLPYQFSRGEPYVAGSLGLYICSSSPLHVCWVSLFIQVEMNLKNLGSQIEAKSIQLKRKVSNWGQTGSFTNSTNRKNSWITLSCSILSMYLPLVRTQWWCISTSSNPSPRAAQICRENLAGTSKVIPPMGCFMVASELRKDTEGVKVGVGSLSWFGIVSYH